MAEHLFCTFHIDGHHYGVPVDDVQEVIINHPRTPVPLAPQAVLGMMNIRGRIVSAIDMRCVLCLPVRDETDDSINVIVRHAGEEVGLVADRIGDVLELDPGKKEPPPETLGNLHREFISGVYPLERHLLLILDIHRVLEDESCLRPASSAVSDEISAISPRQ